MKFANSEDILMRIKRRFMDPLITYVTLVAGIVTIVWFIRDMRRENSQVLKEIKSGQLIMSKILENSQKRLEKIEENTRNK